MKWLSVAALLLLLGLAPGGGLQAQPAAQAARPALAILPLKEEGRRDLGDVSDSMNLVVANAFADSGFRLLGRRPTAAKARRSPTARFMTYFQWLVWRRQCGAMSPSL